MPDSLPAERCAIEPLIHAPQTVESARVRRVGVIDDAVLQDEGAHAGSLACVGGTSVPLMAAILTTLAARRCACHRCLATVVVLDAAVLLFLLGEPDAEIVVEVAAERRGPGNVHPIRCLYACNFASGARDTAESVTSWSASARRRR